MRTGGGAAARSATLAVVLVLLTSCGAGGTAGPAPPSSSAPRSAPSSAPSGSAPSAAGSAPSSAPSPSSSAGPSSAAPAPAPPAPPVDPTPAPGPTAAPLAGVTIVLDPGHNGGNAANPDLIGRPVPDGRGGTKACNTTGTATAGGYAEHAFTWDLAGRVRDLLTARGVRVLLTRPDDAGVGPCVDERPAVATRAGAAALVSLHADGAPGSGAGFHVAHSSPPLNPAQGAPSVALATDLADALRGAGFAPSGYRGTDGLDPRADLAGLNLAEVPTALVECANMADPGDAAVVSSPQGRARYAAAIADGVLAWLARA